MDLTSYKTVYRTASLVLACSVWYFFNEIIPPINQKLMPAGHSELISMLLIYKLQLIIEHNSWSCGEN